MAGLCFISYDMLLYINNEGYYEIELDNELHNEYSFTKQLKYFSKTAAKLANYEDVLTSKK